jgi:uncharacterized membrane protein
MTDIEQAFKEDYDLAIYDNYIVDDPEDVIADIVLENMFAEKRDSVLNSTLSDQEIVDEMMQSLKESTEEMYDDELYDILEEEEEEDRIIDESELYEEDE